MIKLIESYSDFISKEDATYAEGSFVDFAKSVKRYIKSEQMKGRFSGWDVDHYFVPEIDNTTKEIRNDSFALVFTKNKKNMFYIETFMEPDRFTTTITCPILGIRNDNIYNCNGKSDELLYNGGFNSHLGFESMISNYVRPTMKDVDAELDDLSGNPYYSGVYESRKRRMKESSSDFKGYDYKARYEMALNIAKWAFYEPLDPQELGVEDNMEFLWDKYYSSKAGNLNAKTDEDAFFSCESAEELADFLARSSVNKLRHIEIDLGIDEDTLAAEREYLDSFNQ